MLKFSNDHRINPDYASKASEMSAFETNIFVLQAGVSENLPKTRTLNQYKTYKGLI